MTKLFQLLQGVPGSLWRGAVTLVLALVVVAVFWFAFDKLANIGGGKTDPSVILPLLAIGGVFVLILTLTIVAAILGLFGLTDKTQAMGLPEGSIRSVIAVSLIVLFTILAVFLYQGVSAGGHIIAVENLSQDDRAQFIKDHPNASAVIFSDKDGQPIIAKDKDGQPVRNSDGTLKYSYTVTYSSGNVTSDDFAKQLLVLLGTLMTAITSFYLGAGTATSAVAATAGQPTSTPTATGINPTVHSISNGGPAIRLQIMGNNLNSITHVRIARGSAQVVATAVGSSPTGVMCEIPVSAATTPPGPAWDVVFDDGSSKSVTLPGALTINA